MGGKNVFLLVPRVPSNETVKYLERRLTEARAGELIGVATILMYRDRDYEADVVGETLRSPTFTRGMLGKLEDMLRAIIHG